MFNDLEIAENNELMNVFNNHEKEKIAKAINGLSTLDLSNIPNETKEKIIELFKENTLPVERLFANYRCAIMEVETKFKVLNEEFSLIYDGNPIESIKSRIKSNESILKKIIRKDLPLDLESI